MTRIAVVYNDDASLAHGDAQDLIAVQGVVDCARAVAGALREHGHEVEIRALGPDAREALRLVEAISGDLVFNLVESIGGDARREPAFAWLCELCDLRYTGSSPKALTLCVEKPLAQALLAARGIPVPRNVVLVRGDEPLGALPLPAIVKPAWEDASHGIASESVVRDEPALRARARFVIEHYAQPALAEEFIEGREINVGLIETSRGLEVLPLSEIDYSGFPADMPHIVSYAGKWIDTSRDWALTKVVAASDLTAEQRARIESVARSAFEVLGLSGYGRVDMRLDARGNPFAIDVNANPDLSPDAGFSLAAAGGVAGPPPSPGMGGGAPAKAAAGAGLGRPRHNPRDTPFLFFLRPPLPPERTGQNGTASPWLPLPPRPPPPPRPSPTPFFSRLLRWRLGALVVGREHACRPRGARAALPGAAPQHLRRNRSGAPAHQSFREHPSHARPCNGLDTRSSRATSSRFCPQSQEVEYARTRHPQHRNQERPVRRRVVEDPAQLRAARPVRPGVAVYSALIDTRGTPRLYASSCNAFFGMKVLRSTDLGKTFKETKSAPAFPEGGRARARQHLVARSGRRQEGSVVRRRAGVALSGAATAAIPGRWFRASATTSTLASGNPATAGSACTRSCATGIACTSASRPAATT